VAGGTRLAMRSLRRFLLATFLVGVASSLAAQGMTVQDVIDLARSGYDDASILATIAETGTVFQLTPQDLIDLKNAGVSETLMQRMIQGGSAPGRATRPEAPRPTVRPSREPSPAPPLRPVEPAQPPPEVVGQGHVEREPAEPGHAEPGSAYRLPKRSLEWSTYTFHEDAHAGGHEHAAVAYGDIDVILLRAEAGFPSVEARAAAVAAKLAPAFDDASSTFEARPNGAGFGVYRVFSSDHREEEILRVIGADAAAFGKRSPREVDVDVLARWWAALLRDYHRVLTLGERPRDVAELHVGEALVALHERASGAASAGAGKPAAIREALTSLSRTQWEHLKEMATAVPRDFEGQASH